MTATLRPFLAFLVTAVWASTAPGAVRVTPEGLAPFVLLESAVEDTTSWYDAETWLRHFPGAIEVAPSGEEISYQEGPRRSVLLSREPYALKDGQPLGAVPATRVVGGRLAVSEAFLKERSSDILGRRVAVERAHGTGILRIFLDPGHGGSDAGCRGVGNLAEKDAVLALARDAAGRLRKRGFDVQLSRDDDRALDAASRAALANHWNADLLLSLHASGSPRSEANGFETFVAPNPGPSVSSRLWSGGQVGVVEQSRRWALTLRSVLGEALTTFDRGLRELPSPLLEAAACPACLLEAGNLSRRQEADTLTSPQSRPALAEALARAAEAYFRSGP